MSLANFSFPYQFAATSPYGFAGTQNSQSAINNLRLNAVLPPTPAPNFNNDRRFNNEPYIPPARYQQQHQQQHQRQREQQLRAQESYPGHQQQQHQSSTSLTNGNHDGRYANYNQDFRRTQPRQQQIPHQQITQREISQQHVSPQQSLQQQQQIPQQQQQIPQQQQQISQQQQHQQQQIPQQQQHQQQQIPQQQQQQQPQIQRQPRLPANQEHDRVQQNSQHNVQSNVNSRNEGPDNYPGRPDDGYTRINGGGYGSPDGKTSVHAILDYDDDDDESVEDYYDEAETDMPKNPRVTPIQGPIYVKNGSVPVVPLYSYPQLNNGSFVQIPILWTALSVALGVELRGDLVKGTPCIKRYHQLYCPTAGKTYPTDRIEQFIDENKALMKRMYGVFEMDEDYGPPTRQPGKRRRRNVKKYDLPDGGPSLRDKDEENPRVVKGGESFFSKIRDKRQSTLNTGGNESGRVDACESKPEIVTPYWARNSAAKVRAIVNTQHFEQAIHQETCTKTRTNRCQGDCGCEQKYKWHRLLAYDPDDDCKGIFMDWFIFPSCCVCRCDPATTSARTFTSTTSRN